MKKTALYILFFIIVSNIYATVKVNPLSVNRGLSQQDVETVIQDRYGFMWFGTYDGLNRYDGYKIETFRYDPKTPNSIADNRITALFESKDGIIWIGTEGSGLLYFDPSTDKFGKIDHPYLKAGQCGSIYSLQETSDKILLVGSTHALLMLSGKDKQQVQIKKILLDKSDQYRIRNLWLEKNNGLWIGTENGGMFKIIIPELGKPVQTFHENLNNFAYGVIKLSTTRYAVYGEGGIRFYKSADGENFKKEEGKTLFPNDVVIKIVRKSNNWLVLTKNAIYNWDGINEPQLFIGPTQDFVRNNILQTIYIDRSNILWITSRNKGVAQVDLTPEKFEELSLPEKDLFVKSMVILNNNRKSIGIKDFGLLLETVPGSGKYQHLFKGVSVSNQMQDSDKNLWLFNNQLEVMLPSGNLVPVSSFAGYDSSIGYHMSCCEDKQKNVWVGASHAICKADIKSRRISYIKFPKNQNTSSENLSLNIYYNKFDNSLLCCTKEEGLYRYDITANRLQQFTIKNGLTSNHVWSLAIQNDSVMWVGTDVGVNKILYKKGKLHFSPASDDARIRNAKVMAMCFDKKNNLWMTTSQGLFALNIFTSNILEYNYSDGLLSNTLSEVAFMDKEGIIWISSISGLNFFDPEKLNPNIYEPNIVLRNLKVFNESIRPDIAFNGHLILKQSLLKTKEITLRHNENNFQLEVAPIQYSNPSKNTIAYKLSGVDKNWIETRNKIISYNNLPPGNYLLEIKAANSDGIWSNNILQLKINVKPAPWLSWWAYLIYFLIVSSIIVIIYRYYTGRRELKMQLEREQFEHDKERQLNEAKLRFHTNITHEIRTPLALIVAPLYELLQLKIKDEHIQKHIQTIARNTDVLTMLVNQFLDFRKAVTMNYPLRVTYKDLNFIVDKAVALFTEQAQIKGINYQYIYETNELPGWFDEEKISKIVINLISNAIKFTPKNGSIFIFLEQIEDNAQIIVEDTGCGISPEDLPHIYNRYYQSSNNTKGGTGIGLSLSKQLSNIHHGDIFVESELNKGTTFILKFPVAEEAYSESERKKNTAEQPSLSISPLLKKTEETTQNTFVTNDKAVVLIIEDNQELADYMTESLNKKYQVYHTANGNHGFELALTHTPDIILSDIMLEGMDGIQLTQILKNDIRTSHIPVILMSARSSEEEIMEGLHTGAEDYLTKPFNPEVLKLKIANLVKLSRRSKNKSKKDEQKIPLSEREKKFLDQIHQIVLNEMINPDFNIEFICKKIGTNRMQLHRKMITILGITASDFIKQIRFEQAKKLLETTDMNISETMYEVGLSSLYNFTQTFQKLFDQNPSDIIKNRKRNKMS